MEYQPTKWRFGAYDRHPNARHNISRQKLSIGHRYIKQPLSVGYFAMMLASAGETVFRGRRACAIIAPRGGHYRD